MNALGWFVAGTACLWSAASWWRARPVREPKAAALVVSEAGRDQALLRFLQDARTSVFLRTECLTLNPAGNELLQALQRKVTVTVDLPLSSGYGAEASQLPRLLMGQGAVVTFRGDPTANDRGTFLVVDGNRFLYSAMPVILSVPGARVAYVAGPLGR